jgi:hypothetical protein
MVPISRAECEIPESATETPMLKIPRLLEEMLTAGRWPRNAAEANARCGHPLFSQERLQAVAPGEHTIFLLPPPFLTVREQVVGNPFWTEDYAAPDGIDFDLSLDIGDFGIGSDAPILLDYREKADNPCVLRLLWSRGGSSNQWVVMAPDFPTFVAALGL